MSLDVCPFLFYSVLVPPSLHSTPLNGPNESAVDVWIASSCHSPFLFYRSFGAGQGTRAREHEEDGQLISSCEIILRTERSSRVRVRSLLWRAVVLRQPMLAAEGILPLYSAVTRIVSRPPCSLQQSLHRCAGNLCLTMLPQ
jgi:hypothetical protein